MRVVSVGLVAAGLGFGIWLGLGNRPSATATPQTVSSIVTNATIKVHVAGWVAAPGVIQLDEGAIVADAIEAAGGFRQGAAGDRVNLAAPLGDGQQVVVYGPDAAGPAANDETPLPINMASVDQLMDLPGVGPVLAARIVSYREDHGPFTEVEDLLDVPGIGEAKLADLRDLVRVP